MKTIKYTIKESAAGFGDTDGMDVEASLKRYCEELEHYLTGYHSQIDEGYEAEFEVVPVASESEEGVKWEGDEEECFDGHTELMSVWIPQSINEVHGMPSWVVEDGTR